VLASSLRSAQLWAGQGARRGEGWLGVSWLIAAARSGCTREPGQEPLAPLLLAHSDGMLTVLQVCLVGVGAG
jgi:hypothetical protein